MLLLLGLLLMNWSSLMLMLRVLVIMVMLRWRSWSRRCSHRKKLTGTRMNP